MEQPEACNEDLPWVLQPPTTSNELLKVLNTYRDASSGLRTPLSVLADVRTRLGLRLQWQEVEEADGGYRATVEASTTGKPRVNPASKGRPWRGRRDGGDGNDGAGGSSGNAAGAADAGMADAIAGMVDADAGVVCAGNAGTADIDAGPTDAVAAYGDAADVDTADTGAEYPDAADAGLAGTGGDAPLFAQPLTVSGSAHARNKRFARQAAAAQVVDALLAAVPGLTLMVWGKVLERERLQAQEGAARAGTEHRPGGGGGGSLARNTRPSCGAGEASANGAAAGRPGAAEGVPRRPHGGRQGQPGQPAALTPAALTPAAAVRAAADVPQAEAASSGQGRGGCKAGRHAAAHGAPPAGSGQDGAAPAAPSAAAAANAAAAPKDTWETHLADFPRVRRHFAALVKRLPPQQKPTPMERLQVYAARIGMAVAVATQPEAGSAGPYTYELQVANKSSNSLVAKGSGSARTKKDARQLAAAATLDKLLACSKDARRVVAAELDGSVMAARRATDGAGKRARPATGPLLGGGAGFLLGPGHGFGSGPQRLGSTPGGYQAGFGGGGSGYQASFSGGAGRGSGGYQASVSGGGGGGYQAGFSGGGGGGGGAGFSGGAGGRFVVGPAFGAGDRGYGGAGPGRGRGGGGHGWGGSVDPSAADLHMGNMPEKRFRVNSPGARVPMDAGFQPMLPAQGFGWAGGGGGGGGGWVQGDGGWAAGSGGWEGGGGRWEQGDGGWDAPTAAWNGGGGGAANISGWDAQGEAGPAPEGWNSNGSAHQPGRMGQGGGGAMYGAAPPLQQQQLAGPQLCHSGMLPGPPQEVHGAAAGGGGGADGYYPPGPSQVGKSFREQSGEAPYAMLPPSGSALQAAYGWGGHPF